jgi:hypothetical protein
MRLPHDGVAALLNVCFRSTDGTRLTGDMAQRSLLRSPGHEPGSAWFKARFNRLEPSLAGLVIGFAVMSERNSRGSRSIARRIVRDRRRSG